MTTITRFTKEQLIAKAQEQIEFIRRTQVTGAGREHVDMCGALFEIALASLTADPVAWTEKCEITNMQATGLYLRGFPNNSQGRDIALYTAPPASVSVPDALPENDDEEGNDIDYMEPSEVYALGRAAGWNACRAAMLQGSQPLSNRDELPVIGWLRSDYNSDDKRDPNAPLFMLGRNDPSDTWGVKYIPLAGNSPVIPDGLADTKRLDWLDAQNKRLNEYYGTSYGWKFDANFQRNAMMLNDSNYPVMTVRQAIDQAITAAPQQENT